MGGVHIEARDLVLKYGETAALDGLSVTARAGRVLAVVGPSGAGKSTLLQIVAGLTRPDAGDVLFDGASILDRPPEKRDLGVVFQSYALFPHLTVEDNVAFGLVVRGVKRREARRRVAPVLERLEIDRLAGRRPEQLSGGESQRVALARALAFAPRALLLDEPLAALDARLRLALRDDLARRLRDTGVTALYVTHDQEEAMAVGDEIAVLREGRLEQVGAPETLYRRPATGFVASFFGEANFLSGTWEPGGRRFSSGLGTWRLPPEAEAPGGEAGPARLLVRPGWLRPVPESAARFRGRIVHRTFLGDRRRLRVATDIGELEVDVDPGTPAEIGESLALQVALELVVVLPVED